MEYIVYETINLVNNKIYIGVHDSNKFDGYLGNGIWKQNPDSYKKPKTLLGYAINKYGIKNFRRITLKTFKTYLEAVCFKNKLVDLEFIKRNDTYNTLKESNNPIVFQYFNGKLIASYDSDKEFYRAIKSGMKRGDYYYSYTLTDNFIPTKLPSLKGKTIYIYDLEGNYITSLLSGKELKEFFKISHYGNIKEAILNDRPYKEYQLSLEKKDKLHKAKNPTNLSKRVGCYDLEGNLLEEFNSIKQATKKYGSGVFRVLNNRQKQTKGFIFKYL